MLQKERTMHVDTNTVESCVHLLQGGAVLLSGREYSNMLLQVLYFRLRGSLPGLERRISRFLPLLDTVNFRLRGSLAGLDLTDRRLRRFLPLLDTSELRVSLLLVLHPFLFLHT